MYLDIRSVNLIFFLILNTCLSDEIEFSHAKYGFKSQSNWNHYQKKDLRNPYDIFCKCILKYEAQASVTLNVNASVNLYRSL